MNQRQMRQTARDLPPSTGILKGQWMAAGGGPRVSQLCKQTKVRAFPPASMFLGRGTPVSGLWGMQKVIRAPEGLGLDSVSYLDCLGGSRLPPARPVGVLEPEEYSFGR